MQSITPTAPKHRSPRKRLRKMIGWTCSILAIAGVWAWHGAARPSTHATSTPAIVAGAAPDRVARPSVARATTPTRVNDEDRSTAPVAARDEPTVEPPQAPAFAPAAERNAERDDPHDFELPATPRVTQPEANGPPQSPSEASRARTR